MWLLNKELVFNDDQKAIFGDFQTIFTMF